MRRVMIVFLVILLSLSFSLAPVGAIPDERSNLDLNFVLVMDNSGTLSTNDPERLCIDGAKLFVDLLPMTSTNIGTVIFGDGVKYKEELKSTNSASTRQGIKSTISSKMNYSENQTDIGAALDTAVKMLEAAKKRNSAILLFSDGDIRIPVRERERSEKQIQNAIDVCAKNGWHIFTIGLNAGGTGDIDLLRRLSLNTDAGEPLMADVEKEQAIRTEQMHGYFTEIFKRYMDIKSTPIEGQIINGSAKFSIILPQMTAETNIVVTGENIGQVTVTNPKGEAVELTPNSEPTQSRPYYCHEKRYALVKLIAPTPGPWQMEVKGDEGTAIHVQTLNAYDLPLMAEASSTAVDRNEKVTYKAYLMYNGAKIKEKSFYELAKASVEILDTLRNEKTVVPMEVSEDGYSVTTPMVKAGSNRVTITILSDAFTRKSETFEIQVTNHPPQTVGAIADIDLKAIPQASVDLSQHFKDPDGDELSYSCDAEKGSAVKLDDLAKFEFNGNTMNVMPAGKNGSAKVILTASDGYDAVQQTFMLKVENGAPYIKQSVGQVKMRTGESVSFRMEDLFADPENLPMNYQITRTGDAGSYTLEDGIFTINTNKDGDTQFTLTAEDSAGVKVSQEAKASSYNEVIYIIQAYWPIAAGLILALIILMIILSALKKVRGKFKVSLMVQETSKKPDAFSAYDIPAPRKAKKKFTLKSLLDDYFNRMIEDGYTTTDEKDSIDYAVFDAVIFQGTAAKKVRIWARKRNVTIFKGNDEARKPIVCKAGEGAITFKAKPMDNTTISVMVHYIG